MATQRNLSPAGPSFVSSKGGTGSTAPVYGDKYNRFQYYLRAYSILKHAEHEMEMLNMAVKKSAQVAGDKSSTETSESNLNQIGNVLNNYNTQLRNMCETAKMNLEKHKNKDLNIATPFDALN